MKSLPRSEGAAWGIAFTAFLLNQAVNAGAGLFVAAHLDPASFGTVSIARTVLFLAATVTPLGLDLALQRTFATSTFDEIRRNRLLGVLRAIPLALSLGLLAMAAAGGAAQLESDIFTSPGFTPSLILCLVALPFWTDLAVLGAAFRGVLAPLPSIIAQAIVQPLARLLAVAVLVYSGWAFWALPAGLAIGYAAGWAVLMPRAARIFGGIRLPDRAILPEVQAVLRYSLPLGLALAAGSAMRMVDVLILGYFLPAQDAGRYAVTLLLAQLVALVGAASGQTLGPRIAAAWAGGDLSAIAHLQRSNAVMVALAAAPLFACVLFWGGRITLLIGHAYEIDGLVLAVLALAAGLTAVTGNLGHALGMTGHHKAEAAIVGLALAVQIALCVALIPLAGALGAAVAVLAAAAVLWLLRVLMIKRRLGLTLLDVAALYPFLGALGIGLAVWQADRWMGYQTVASTAAACFTVLALYGLAVWLVRRT